MNVRNFALAKTKTISKVVLVSIIVLSSVAVVNTRESKAQSADQLRAKIAQLESQIASSEKEAEHFHEAAETLQEAIDDIQIKINAIQKQIGLTELKLKELSLKLEQTRAELEKQKAILSSSIREHYKMGEVTTIELIASSDNFSDFFNQKDYLDQVRSKIYTASQEVARLEKELETQHAEQEALQARQVEQRNEQNAVKASKQKLLNEYKGREAAFAARAADLKKQREKADKELRARMARALTAASLGPVSKGQAIAMVGNTGYSTSEHLHFELWVNGVRQNPVSEMNARGYAWPVPGYGITQDYKGAAHDGIDIGTQGRKGVPAVAVADGEIIFNGCNDNYPYRNYTIEIRHAGGVVTRYVHLQPPANDARFDSCRANTYPG